MPQRVLRERFGIETVDDLREAIADAPGAMSIRGALGDPVKLEYLQDMTTGQRKIAVS